MRSGAEGPRGPVDLGFEPTEAERRTQVQILSLRLLGRGAEILGNQEFRCFFTFKKRFRKMGVKSTVTNLVTNPSQLIQRGLAHSFSCK